MSFGNAARSVLSHASIFELYQRAVGAPECHRRFLQEFAKPRPGEKVIDLGCGTGASLSHLETSVCYVGIDIDAGYIAAARQRFGNRGTFLCADLTTVDISQYAPFDLAISFGVLHHLNDAAARSLLGLAGRVVRPGGRLVTIDPCYVQNQSSIARFLNDHDRGRHIRPVAQYRQLFAGQASLETIVLADMLRIPYNMIVAMINFG